MKTKGVLRFVFTNNRKTVHRIGKTETREQFAKRVSRAVNAAIDLHTELKTFKSYKGKGQVPVHRRIAKMELILGGKDCSDALKGFEFSGREFAPELEGIIGAAWKAYDKWRRNGGQSFEMEVPELEEAQAN